VPPDEALLNRVRDALGGHVEFEERKMFAGITFMVRGKMCVSVGPGRMMCRIDPGLHDSVVQREGCKTVIMKGREYRGFVYVDGDVLKTRRELEYWIRLALDYNSAVKPSSRKKG
jgi:TfoX/Sxy family transcriptional regulator of competence genes